MNRTKALLVRGECFGQISNVNCSVNVSACFTYASFAVANRT